MPGIFKLKPLLGFAALVALAHAAPAPLFGIHLGSGDESSETPSDVSQNTISTDLVRFLPGVVRVRRRVLRFREDHEPLLRRIVRHPLWEGKSPHVSEDP